MTSDEQTPAQKRDAAKTRTIPAIPPEQQAYGMEVVCWIDEKGQSRREVVGCVPLEGMTKAEQNRLLVDVLKRILRQGGAQ
jgi:hypothetical protein